MGNKLVKFSLIKVVFVFPLIFLSLYAYAKYDDNVFLYVMAFFLLLAFAEFVLIVKIFSSRLKDDNGKNEEIGELRQKILRQESEIEALTASTSEITLVRDELVLKDEELKVLREASQMITSTFDVKNIIEYVYNVFNRFTSCDRYLICFPERRDGEAESLACRYEYGSMTFDKVGHAFEKGSIVWKCYMEKKTLIIKDDWLESRNTKGDKISIPLNVSGEGVGVIYIESAVPGAFADISVEFFESLSAYVATSIKNAELFNSIYLQKQEIEALYEQTTAVNEELNRYIEELNETKEELKKKNDTLTKYYDDIQTGYLQTVMALANSIEAKDPYTRGHCQRVMEISCEIAKTLGYRDDEIDELRYAAILHDIGKIGISASILNKAGKLTEEEFSEIKKHPLIAYNILKDVLFIKEGLEGILQHHERYDGKGYPNGIKQNEICKFGRILCVADAFDAMTSDRPYRKGMSMEDAVREVERCRGTQFDPQIADVFIEMSRKIINEVK